MIAAWILYALLVGVFLAAGARVVENLLRAHRLPTRWVWVGAMVLTLIWPVVPLLWKAWPRGSTPLPPMPPAGGAVLEPLAVQVTQESFLRALDGPILATWLLSTSVLLVLFGFLIVRTRRLRRGWVGDEAGGEKVLFSNDLGPAVVGYLRPEIVLPAWCRDLEEQTLRMIIDHEKEHLKAGDLRLMLSAGVLPLLFPWHLPLWWQFKHLRIAVEGDCDLRVVRRYPEGMRTYLELLLEVGGREPRTAALVAMLSDPEKTLAQRIKIMTMPFPRKPWLRGVLLAGLGGMLTAVACWAPSPREADMEVEEAMAVEVPSSPSTGEAMGSAGPSDKVEIKIPPVPAQIARASETGGRSEAPTLSPDATARETPADALKHFYRVTADYVVRWIQGLLDRILGADASDPSSGQAAVQADGDISSAPTFTPYTVRPDIKNRSEVARALEREYPPLLRDAGIGGTVQVWFFIDAGGEVSNAQIEESSGHEALDDAALAVAEVIEFTPALNRDKPVPVWISLPITFTTRGGQEADRNEADDAGAGNAPGWPEPPGLVKEDVGKAPTFTPYTVRPDIKNRSEVARALESHYPGLLRDAGIGGTTQVWFFIEASGRVANTQINESSGHKALDDAALAVANIIEFTPALNRDEPVPVWISLPITFSVQ